MLYGAKLGKRFAGGFETITPHNGILEALDYLQRIVNGKPLSLLLWGKTGRGKTRLVAAMLNELERKWPDGRYCYWPLAELDLKRKWAIGAKAPDPLEAALEAHVVVIDDMGVEPSESAFALEAIQVLVDRRWREQKPLVCTTNLVVGGPNDQFQARYDARIMRRFMGSDARIIEVSGPNWSVLEATGQAPQHPQVSVEQSAS